MSKIDISKGLKSWAEQTKTKIEKKIVDTDTIDTGALLKSIVYKTPSYSGSSKTWFVDFSMLWYGKFTDEPNSRVKKQPKPPREFFNKLIEDESDKIEDYIEDEIYFSIQKKLKFK